MLWAKDYTPAVITNFTMTANARGLLNDADAQAVLDEVDKFVAEQARLAEEQERLKKELEEADTIG